MATPRTTTSGLRIPAHQTEPPTRRGSSTNKWLIGILLVLLVATGFMAYQLFTLKANPSLQGDKEIARIVKKVGRLVVLPENETPTLATVSDPEKLKNQPFFANAKQGDKVLLYNTAKKAILYDPKLDRVIEIAPINANPTPADPEASGGDNPKTDSGSTETPASTTP